MINVFIPSTKKDHNVLAKLLLLINKNKFVIAINSIECNQYIYL